MSYLLPEGDTHWQKLTDAVQVLLCLQQGAALIHASKMSYRGLRLTQSILRQKLFCQLNWQAWGLHRCAASCHGLTCMCVHVYHAMF